MAFVIGIVNTKGGTGKSLVSSTVSIALQSCGSVAIIDADSPQESCGSWAAVRNKNPKLSQILIEIADKDLITTLERLDKYDFLIIDAPSRDLGINELILKKSDLVIVPVTPSYADLWATQDVIAHKNTCNPNVPMYLMWNKMGQTTPNLKKIQQEMENECKTPSLKTQFRNASGYADAFAEGKIANEINNSIIHSSPLHLRTEIYSIVTSLIKKQKSSAKSQLNVSIDADLFELFRQKVKDHNMTQSAFLEMFFDRFFARFLATLKPNDQTFTGPYKHIPISLPQTLIDRMHALIRLTPGLTDFQFIQTAILKELQELQEKQGLRFLSPTEPKKQIPKIPKTLIFK